MSSSPPYKEIQSDRIGPVGPSGEGGKPISTPSQSFQSFMKETGAPKETNLSLESPFDLAQKQRPLAAGPTFDTLIAQTKTVQSTLGDIQTQLNTPNLKLNQGRKYLLKNKLTEANAHLRSANSKLGVGMPIKEDKEETVLPGPFGKFIDLVTSGQLELEGAKKQLQDLKEKGTAMTPGDFLLVQIKMNTAQQNLEFSSVLLGKAVEDIKSLMQVQL